MLCNGVVMSQPGVYRTQKKNGETYYRSSFTFRNRHISLGSFETEKDAHDAYRDALRLCRSDNLTIREYNPHRFTIPFEKYVSIINFRDNDVFFANPIYLQERYFEYYFTKELYYKFDIDDLFYYAGHKIVKRGNHLFVADYGMQVNLLSRYGIKSHAVLDRDYRFINNDRTDFRYENIEVINPYIGVQKTQKKGQTVYKASILVNGTFVIGYYDDAETAAIAYNKAADRLEGRFGRHYRQNYIESLSPREYADLYAKTVISARLP